MPIGGVFDLCLPFEVPEAMEVSMLPNEGSKVEKPDERLIKASPPRHGKKNIYVGVGCGDASDQQDCYMLGSAGSTGSTIKPKICHWYWEGATAR